MENMKPLNVGVIDYPYPKKVRKSYRFTPNLLTILQSLSIVNRIYYIGDNTNIKKEKIVTHSVGIAPHFLHEISPRWLSFLIWILKSIAIQAKICWNIFKVRKNVDVFIFFMMYPYVEVAVMLFIKFLNKKIIKTPILPSVPAKIYGSYSIYHFFETVSYYLSDYLIPEYEPVLHHPYLKEHPFISKKMLSPAHFFLLEDMFKPTKSFEHRDDIVAYIGGFRETKGVMNFVRAIPLVINRNEKIKFLLIGEGILKDKIKNVIGEYPQERVNLIDWVSHNELPTHLNNLKLLVVPSYGETGPFVAVEAMMCGTPVLGTSTPLLSFLVKNNDNGFIMENNKSEIIADKILEVLRIENLGKIAKKAYVDAVREFSFGVTCQKWEKNLAVISADINRGNNHAR